MQPQSFVVVYGGMQNDHRKIADERFGTNVRAERERAGISQKAIATAMNERGHAWHQQTVVRVEAGRQPVRIGEAEDLAKILHTSLDRLTWTTQEASAALFLDSVIARTEGAWEKISAGTRELLYCIWQLSTSVGEAERAGCYGSDRVERIVQEAKVVLEGTPEGALESGRRQFEELRETGELHMKERDDDAQGES